MHSIWKKQIGIHETKIMVRQTLAEVKVEETDMRLTVLDQTQARADLADRNLIHLRARPIVLRTHNLRLDAAA